jgi:hypothetical protein
MNREDLTNHIKGSYLKKQYLESFLVQSAYIEGLLKLLADYSFWDQNKEKIKEGGKMILNLRKRVGELSLSELVKFLHESDLIDKEQKECLNKYRSKRNSVLRDLVSKLQNAELNNEIKEACDLGNEIITKDNFKTIEKIIDELEKIKIEAEKIGLEENKQKILS